MSITLKTLNRKELQDFIDSGKYAGYDFLPITKHRAVSQLKNPKADPEDVLLTLAFEEDRLAGYLGTFPDYFLTDGKKQKFAWLSTLYVSEKFRGKRIAQKLLDKVFQSYNGNIAITEFTKEAEGLYNKMGVFRYIAPKNGKRYYFHSDLKEIWKRKKINFVFVPALLDLADLAINTGFSLFRNTRKKNFKTEINAIIDEESIRFIAEFPSSRNGEDINWIIQNPWVIQSNLTEEKYLFSSYSKEFRYDCVKIFDENEKLISVCVLLLRDGNLKIPYLFSKEKPVLFAHFLNNYIQKNKVKFLTSYHPELNSLLDKRNFKKIFGKDFERRYLLHENLIDKLPENFSQLLQDGDGDPAFT